MVLLSGEVETAADPLRWPQAARRGSGWFCYPGKLKPERVGVEGGQVRRGSGWFCYPGTLKLTSLADVVEALERVPDGFAIRGS